MVWLTEMEGWQHTKQHRRQYSDTDVLITYFSEVSEGYALSPSISGIWLFSVKGARKPSLFFHLCPSVKWEWKCHIHCPWVWRECDYWVLWEMSIVKGEVAFPEDPSTSSTTISRKHREGIMILLLCASLILLFVVSILAFFILGKVHFVVPSFHSSKETNETKPCDHHKVVVVEMSHHDSSPHLSTLDFSELSEMPKISNHPPPPVIQV